MKEESLLLLSDLQKLINQVVLIDYTIIILGGDNMFPTINKKETGVNLRRIMDMRGVKPKDIQEYLGVGCVQSVYRWLDGVSMSCLSIKRFPINIAKKKSVWKNIEESVRMKL